MRIKKEKIVKTACIITAVLILLVLQKEISAQNKDYHLGPRDVITLTIFAGGEKQQEVNLTVSSQGEINIPFIGSVEADGLTITQLEKVITVPLAEDYFVDPEVNIFVKEYHSLRYTISGAVKSPGTYEMESETSLLKLIAEAGGVLPERGNVAFVFREATEKIQENGDVEKLISSDEPSKVVDLKNLLDKGDMTHNLILKSGDLVYIPLEESLDQAESKIYVEGEVKKPGVYKYQPGLTALNACIMAGGFADFAAPNRTIIIRKTGDEQVTIKINLNDVKEGKEPDIELQPGDRITIPESWL